MQQFLVLCLIVGCVAQQQLWNEHGGPMGELLQPLFWKNNRGRNKLEKYLKIAMSEGVDVNVRNTQGWTALTFAVEHQDAEAMKILINEYSANVNTRENDDWTPLLFAAYHGHIDIVESLVFTHNADPSLLNKAGVGPMTFLRNKGHHGLADKITSHALNNVGENWDADNFSTSETILRLLQDAYDDHPDQTGGFANHKNSAGWTPLHFCSHVGNIDCVRYLLSTSSSTRQKYTSLHVDVNAIENDGWSALMIAASQGRAEIVEALLEHTGEVQLKDQEYVTVGGIEVGLKNGLGFTALEIAISRLEEYPEDRMRAQVVSVLQHFHKPVSFTIGKGVKHNHLNPAPVELDSSDTLDVIAGGGDEGSKGFFAPVISMLFGGESDTQQSL